MSASPVRPSASASYRYDPAQGRWTSVAAPTADPSLPAGLDGAWATDASALEAAAEDYGHIVRARPIAVLRPMIGASEAVSKALLGLQNSMDPNVRLENEAKYKHRS